MITFKIGQRILGIDPGSVIAGFAVLEARRSLARLPSDFHVIDVGVMRPKSSGNKGMPRLGHLHSMMLELLEQVKPHYVVIEKAFVGLNARSALRLGEARGAMIAATERQGCALYELTPAEIKQTIAGNGRASKELIARAVTALVGFKSEHMPFDATDALACALTLAVNPMLTNKTPGKRKSSLGAVAAFYENRK